MFIPYDIVILLILSPFLLIIWIVVWVAVRLFRLALFLAKWAVILSYRILRWSAAGSTGKCKISDLFEELGFRV